MVIDNRVGLSASAVGLDKSIPVVKYIENIAWGESEIPDCPQQKAGGYCELYEKVGIETAVIMDGTEKGLHPPKRSPMPFHGTHHEEGYMWGHYEMKNNKLIGFTTSTKLGSQQYATGMQLTSDYLHPSFWDNNEFINCSQDAMGYMFTPPSKWAIVKDCGDFPCTGPLNALFSFKGTKFTGTLSYLKEKLLQSTFQIIPNNDGFAPFVSGCIKIEKWNAYVCENDFFGNLVWESLDADR